MQKSISMGTALQWVSHIICVFYYYIIIRSKLGTVFSTFWTDQFSCRRTSKKKHHGQMCRCWVGVWQVQKQPAWLPLSPTTERSSHPNGGRGPRAVCGAVPGQRRPQRSPPPRVVWHGYFIPLVLLGFLKMVLFLLFPWRSFCCLCKATCMSSQIKII